MGAYLDRLTEQFDEVTDGIDEILNRAAAENREVTDDENTLVEREKTKGDELKKAIEHYTELEVSRAKVAETRAKVPTVARSARPGGDGKQVVVVERSAEEQIKGLFPTAGHWIETVARAMRGDKTAGETIARATELLRATAHQTTADNPGLLPRPIAGPLITLVDAERPFVNSVNRLPLPINQFDRPKVEQHVAVGLQAAEKTLTDSRQLKVGKLPVSAETFAGHLNLSLQDIRWTQPGILQLVANDFAVQYALETEQAASEHFLATIADVTPTPIGSWDPGAIRRALFSAATVPILAGKPLGRPDTLWLSADQWAAFGGLVNAFGLPVFPNLSPGDQTAGDVAGFRPVLGPFFPPGTAVLGPARLNEFYEDLEGFLSVTEPSVLGQLVGYAGYAAFLNTEPSVFVRLSLPPVEDAEAIVAAGVDDAGAKATGKK